MKVKHYNEMMAYLTRPGFNGGGSVRNKTVLPKRKPKAEIKRRQKINYEKIKQYLEDESQEFIERELGFAVGGRVNPAQLKQRFMQLVASIPDADDAEIPGIVAQAKQIKDQIDEINKSLAPERQIKITAEGLEFDNPLLDAAKIAQTVGTTQEVTGGLTENIAKDVVPETLTTKNPIYEGVPDYNIRGALGVDEREKDDPKIDGRVGITPDRKFMQTSMKMEGRRTSKNLRDYLRNIDLAATEGSFAKGGSVIGKPGGLVEPGVMYYGTSKVKTGKFKYKISNQHGTFYTDKPGKRISEKPLTPAERAVRYREKNPRPFKVTEIVADGVKYSIPNYAMKPENAKGFIKFLNKLEKDSTLKNYRKLIAKEPESIQRLVRTYRAYLQNDLTTSTGFSRNTGDLLKELFEELKLPKKSANFLKNVTTADIKAEIIKTSATPQRAANQLFKSCPIP